MNKNFLLERQSAFLSCLVKDKVEPFIRIEFVRIGQIIGVLNS